MVRCPTVTSFSKTIETCPGMLVFLVELAATLFVLFLTFPVFSINLSNSYFFYKKKSSKRWISITLAFSITYPGPILLSTKFHKGASSDPPIMRACLGPFDKDGFQPLNQTAPTRTKQSGTVLPHGRCSLAGRLPNTWKDIGPNSTCKLSIGLPTCTFTWNLITHPTHLTLTRLDRIL